MIVSCHSRSHALVMFNCDSHIYRFISAITISLITTISLIWFICIWTTLIHVLWLPSSPICAYEIKTATTLIGWHLPWKLSFTLLFELLVKWKSLPRKQKVEANVFVVLPWNHVNAPQLHKLYILCMLISACIGRHLIKLLKGITFSLMNDNQLSNG